MPAVGLGDPAAGTIFAQTWLYLPDAQECVVVLATRSPYAVYVNARQVDSKWFRPCAETYGQLTDGFAFRISVPLNAGWNSLLLKFLHNPASSSAAQACGFALRKSAIIRSAYAR